LLADADAPPPPSVTTARPKRKTAPQWFFEHFKATLGELPEIPEETKAAAVASVAATRVYFAPITDDEVASGAYALAPAPGGAAAPAADGGGGADACTVAGAAGGDAAAAGVAVV
jgi:hypothetical protein